MQPEDEARTDAVRGTMFPDYALVQIRPFGVLPGPDPAIPDSENWVTVSADAIFIGIDGEPVRVDYRMSCAPNPTARERRTGRPTREMTVRLGFRGCYVRLQSLTGGENSPQLFIPNSDAVTCAVRRQGPDANGVNYLEVTFSPLAGEPAP